MSSNSDSEFGGESDQPTLPPKSSGGAGESEQTLPPSENRSRGELSSREFGDYELTEEIARGGMGVVYRGRQKSLDRKVAIKMILAGQFASSDEVDRFYTEATAAARLDHPNIVPVYDFGEVDGHHFFSMKLIDGKDLGQRLSELGKELPTAVCILRKVCDAVHHAHQRGVLHRDLKPGNILLDSDNEPFITDLGLARQVNEDSRLTKTGAVIGTPSYMPPEQAAGDSDITTAADIYSLGAILYEVLSGRPPFQGATPVETLMQVMTEQPQRPSMDGNVDRALESICLKCLAKDPADRYTSAADLSGDLSRWINGEPVSVRSPSIAKATKFWLKQNFGSAIWALVIGPIMGVISATCFWYSTIGLDTSNVDDAFAALPSAEMPFSIGPWQMPAGSQVPLMILFAMSIVFIGYVTARFVNPKHRGADLAAGTIVGLFASLAAFMVALGPVCVLTVLKYTDMEYINQIASSDVGATPAWIVDVYPELEEMNRGRQIRTLSSKMESEHFLMVPKGLWLGAFVSLSLYFIPCLFETFVAGPILRKQKTWWRSLPAYLEVTFPAVVLIMIVALFAITWLVLGGFGFRWTIRLAALLSLIFVALIAVSKRWNLVPRLCFQALLAGAFVWFFATDFPSIPGVAGCNSQLAKAQRRIGAEPQSFKARIGLVNAHLTYAAMLRNYDRISEANSFSDSAVQEADNLAELAAKGLLSEVDEAVVQRLRCICQLRRIVLRIEQGDFQSATSELESVRAEFPDDPDLPAIEAMLQKAQSTDDP